MIKIILGIFLFFVSFLLTAFIPKLVLNQESQSFFPNAVERILGYVLMGLFGLLSLILFHNLNIGIVALLLLSLFAMNRVWRHSNSTISWNLISLNYSNAIKVAFLLVITAIYGPMMFYHGVKYVLPNIFDLPKQLSAIISATHAHAWPVPNPYFPNLSFAYNLLFYIPLGFIVNILRSVPLIFILFGLSVMWVAWEALSLLEIVLEKLAIDKKFFPFALLFATFFIGLTPLFMQSDNPLGWLLAKQIGSPLWVDDPITSFIFVPQHFFAVLCVVAAWVIGQAQAKIELRFVMQLILLMAGSLSSLILAPLIQLVFLFLLLTNIIEIRRQKQPVNYLAILLPLIIYASVVLYFILQAKGWAHHNEPIYFGIKTSLRDWYFLILEFGYFIPLLILGFLYIKTTKNKAVWLSYSFLSVIALFYLLFVYYPDSDIKTTCWLRYVLIPIAIAGLAYLYERIKQIPVLVYATIVFPLLFFTLLDVMTVGFFISSAYQKNDPAIEQVEMDMQHVPFKHIVLMIDSNEDIAAISGHLVYMDMRKYRDDAYLPASQAIIANNFFLLPLQQQIAYNSKISNFYFDGYVVNTSSLALEQKTDLTLKDFNWKLWGNKKTIISSNKRNDVFIKSNILTDNALLAPIHLNYGLYHVTVTVTGYVTGQAHVSLFAERKLINIPAGNYLKPTTFQTTFMINQKNYAGLLAFGLGGWGEGAGDIKLRNLQISSVDFEKG